MKNRDCAVIRKKKEVTDQLKNIRKGEFFRLIPRSETDPCDKGWWKATGDASVSKDGDLELAALMILSTSQLPDTVTPITLKYKMGNAVLFEVTDDVAVLDGQNRKIVASYDF